MTNWAEQCNLGFLLFFPW